MTVRRGKWIILLTCLLLTGATVAYTLTQPPVYEARALVAIEEMQPESPGQLFAMSQQRDLNNEIGILEHSGQLTQQVVTTLRAIADTSSARFTLFAPNPATGAPVDALTIGDRLHNMVSFNADLEQGMIHITASSESPQEAAALANIYATEYRLFSQSMARANVAAARRLLESQLERRRGDIRSIEATWESFARSNAVVTEGQDGQVVAQQYVQLQTQRDGLQFQLEQEERTLALLRTQLEQVQPALRASVLDERRARSLEAEIQALDEQIAALKTEAEQYYIVTPSLRGNEARVPELADLKMRIDGFEARKLELTEELIDTARDQEIAPSETGTAMGHVGTLRQRITEQEQLVEQLNAQIAGIGARIRQQRERIQNIPQQTIQREQIERRLRQAETFHNTVAMELQRTRIAEQSELGYVQVIRAATVPTIPVRPKKTQNTLLAVLLSLGVGVGLAFLRQSMNWQLHEPADVPSNGYTLLGVIPQMDREIKTAFNGEATVSVEGAHLSTSLVPLLNPWSPITENYRMLRTNLHFVNGHDAPETAPSPQVLMVTSPEPGDGKTTTAVNLAITLALSGRRVLLIDGDMRRPTVHKLLGLPRSPGLAEMLMGQDDRSIVQGTFLDTLYVVPAGTPETPPTELLDSKRMHALIEMGRQRCDAIIIDSPPVLAVSDPLVLGTLCDAALVVVSASKTDLRALQQAEDTLGAVGIPIEGVVYNRHNTDRAGSGYRYGYDYSYDYTPAA
mgnify:FL=1